MCMLVSFNSSIDVVYVHGVVCPAVRGVCRVFFGGLRDGDVTVWYQSSRLQQWASMGQEDVVTEAVFLLPSRKQWKTVKI